MADLQQIASTYFDLKLPTSSVALKKAYRRRCMELHPDTTYGDAELFKQMQAAYNELTNADNIATVITDEECQQLLSTVGGTPLSELGLGLGPTVNGSDCPECHHKGYLMSVEPQFVRCECGGGPVYRSAPCKGCQGTGTVKLAIGLRVVPCQRCNGTGRYVFRGFHNLIECPKCGGTGARARKGAGKTIYQKCWKCRGTGELPMWNPVIPKSALR